MQKQESSVNEDSNGMEISLLDLVRPLWRSRWLIVIVTAAVTVCGTLIALYVADFKSEGTLQFGGQIPIQNKSMEKEKDKDETNDQSPGISLADYKRFSAAFSTPERFAEYIHDRKLDSEKGVADLRKAFASREGITDLVEPIYPFTKSDAKTLIEQPTQINNKVIGLHISATNEEAETTQRMVGLLGRYTVDSILYVAYTDAIPSRRSAIASRLLDLDNKIIHSKEKREEYQRRIADLKQIVSRYPKTAFQASQQVVSVDKESARYLSPLTQLATTEVQASEVNEDILKAKREQQQAILWGEYYKQAETLLASTKSGETVLRGLNEVRDRVFKGKNLDDEVIKEVFNEISMDNQKAKSIYLERTRFVAGPTLASRSTARPALALVLSFMLGLIGSLALVYARSWWRNNRAAMNT